ncbi:lysophospholipase-like protein A [Paraphoma chrysanthemicola]|uniref:Lysophospholipase-like protein A n=1 Tax=Paraphoma chrysanthemicola TaxID=798071 RepID=A0A8K0VV56_9PLEO|nr:lysophospholipase-like protein A [Paraphoma chrysanthemicola]
MKVQSFAALALATCTAASPSSLKNKKFKFDWNKTKSLIAFGDSYTFVQGTLGHQNYTFIGDNFNKSFTPEKLFSNRIVLNVSFSTEGTAEGGPNWVEYLTKCGTKKGLTDPRTCHRQLWDFAYAGANTVSEAGFTPAHWNHTVSFQQQIEQFVSYGNPALETIKLKKKDALVAIWIGINDINDLKGLRGKNATFAPLYEKVAGYVWESVEKIYQLGYRNYLVMNLPPLDRGPSASLNASLVKTFNDIAASHANDFAANHSDATVLQYDLNGVLNNILDNYQEYGFKNITNFCPGYAQPDIYSNPGKYGCGEGLSTYFWYNSGHLTSRTHEIFSGMLEKWLVSKSGRN